MSDIGLGYLQLGQTSPTLSGGEAQRIKLTKELSRKDTGQTLYLLDEPTTGLDPIQIIGIRELIKQLAKDKTIILSTHILPEVSTVSDRILVISRGRVVADGSFDDLISKVTKRGSIYIAVKTGKKDFQAAMKSITEIDELSFDGTVPRNIVGCHIYYNPAKIDMVAELNKIIRERKWDILDFRRERLSLEESFIRLTQSSDLKNGSSNNR